MLKTLASTVLLAAAATTLPMVLASPAHAGVSNTSYHRLAGDSRCDDNNLRNRGQFVHTSDNLRSTDECPEGWGADTELLLTNGRHERCYNTGGNDTTLVGNFDFAENVAGQILARSYDNGSFKSSGTVVLIVT